MRPKVTPKFGNAALVELAAEVDRLLLPIAVMLSLYAGQKVDLRAYPAADYDGLDLVVRHEDREAEDRSRLDAMALHEDPTGTIFDALWRLGVLP